MKGEGAPGHDSGGAQTGSLLVGADDRRLECNRRDRTRRLHRRGAIEIVAAPQPLTGSSPREKLFNGVGQFRPGRSAIVIAMGEIPDLRDDALDRYLAAKERTQHARAEWEAAGQPLLYHGPRGGLQPHPYLIIVMRLERQAAALLEQAIKRRRPGREVVAVPGVHPSPAAVRRLHSVENGDGA